MTEREVMAELVRFVGVLTYGKERWFKQNGCWYDRMFGDCIQNEVFLERITEAINDEIADRPTGWIPVSERLPENSGCVLISIAGDIEFGAYDKQNSDWAIWRDGYWAEGKRADAWMPLPKPYREDGE